MKKTITLFFLSVALMGGLLRAQAPLSIPNGSFEQWDSHSGYSVTVLFMPVEVYDTFSTPSVWDYPSYPVNQTVTFYGMSVNINTSIPLIKASREAGSVPDGDKAVKLQTFMLEDIINPTVLSLAGDNIDTSISQQVIPSILSTGAIDINAFIPLLSDLMSGSGDIYSMLPSLLAMDVNDYITGGLALGDFKPGRLTGSYKYQSATSGDNGGVLLLGTRYNSDTHHRDIVGGGINLALTDTGVFTPFETEYMTLNGVAPDSLVVLLFSSASSNRQQGSSLYLDNLMLWPAPDTCADITFLAAVPDIHEARISWDASGPAEGVEIAYGPAEFPSDSSTVITASGNALTLYNLAAATTYNLSIRTICSDDIYGEWSSLQFTTLTDSTTTAIRTLTNSSINALTVSPNPANGQCIVATIGNMPAELKLYTVDGRLIQTLTTDGSPTTLNLPKQGIFLLHATTSAGIATYKIVSK